MKSVREVVEEILDEVIGKEIAAGPYGRMIALETTEILVERLRSEGLLLEEEEPSEEVLDAVRGNLIRGLEREPAPEVSVLPAPSRARRLPREGVRMICLEDDEEGRVCYLDLGHDGAHGFELVEGGPVRSGGPVLAVDPCPGWTDEELERFARAFGGRVTRVVVDCRIPPGRPVLIPSLEERANAARREAGHAG